jgi:predicted enzyme related to lactoylglutathione lyase
MTSTLLGRPLWYELMTTDMKAAEAFYRNVIGWTPAPFDGAGQPYTMFNRPSSTAASSEASSVGGMMTKPDDVKAPPFWAMYIGVPKLEEAAAQITRLGGRAHTEVITVPNVGRMQLMADPQGAVFYIYEPSGASQRPEAAPEIGEASWHELMTTDWRAAMKFYEDVFHWQPSEKMDMGDMGTYQMFNRQHGMIGGIMNKPPQMAGVPPNWQIYFRVPDVHAAAERVKANGGQIVSGPMEVPGGDWVASAIDPQGAAFGLHAKKG